MWWRRLLLVVHVLRAGGRVPRDRGAAWDRYWGGVEATGDGGDVLWDSGRPEEALRYAELLAAHADPARPVLDVGCGNGRHTRVLAARFARVVGVDLSPHAVGRARRESGPGGPEFRVADLTAPGAGRGLGLAPCTVFVRGVLHVLDPAARARLAAEAAELTGPGGVVLIAETNHRGSLLGYLESLGAGPRGLPRPLARAIATGIPSPSRFGRAELDAAFPEAEWERVLLDEDARIAVVPLPAAPGRPHSVPGLLALLRRRAGG